MDGSDRETKVKTKLINVICDYENDRNETPNRVVIRGDDDQFVECIDDLVDMPDDPLDNIDELEIFGIDIVHKFDNSQDLPYIYVDRVSDSE